MNHLYQATLGLLCVLILSACSQTNFAFRGSRKVFEPAVQVEGSHLGSLRNAPIIDIHTHMFNARYLPLRGIYGSRGIPTGISAFLERVTLAFCDSFNFDDAQLESEANDPYSLNATMMRNYGRMDSTDFTKKVNESYGGALKESLIEPERAKLARHLGLKSASGVAVDDQFVEACMELIAEGLVDEHERPKPRGRTAKPKKDPLNFAYTITRDEVTIGRMFGQTILKSTTPSIT